MTLEPTFLSGINCQSLAELCGRAQVHTPLCTTSPNITTTQTLTRHLPHLLSAIDSLPYSLQTHLYIDSAFHLLAHLYACLTLARAPWPRSTRASPHTLRTIPFLTLTTSPWALPVAVALTVSTLVVVLVTIITVRVEAAAVAVPTLSPGRVTGVTQPRVLQPP